MRGTIGSVMSAGAALLALGSSAPGAGAKEKMPVRFWTHPQVETIVLRSVALLPAATYDSDYKAEQEIEIAWSQVARTSGYRWLSSAMSKDLLRRAFGGDAVLRELRQGLLKDARVDSLSARALCAALRTSAVLSIRADHWVRIRMNWNERGTPSTTVALRAALVDSTGRLLWTAAGTEAAQGLMHERSDPYSLSYSDASGPPSFQDVLARLFKHWMESFPPARASQSAPAAPAVGDL